MKLCWINENGKIECTFSVHCYDVVKPADLENWMAKGRYIPLTECLANLFGNLICHKQRRTIINKMNRLLELLIEQREFDKCKIRKKKISDFKVIVELILNEKENLAS